MKDFRERTELHDYLNTGAKLRWKPRGIWLGSGLSTGEILKKPAGWLDENYDVVVCANASHEYWHQQAQNCQRAKWFWLCPEEGHINQSWYWTVPEYMHKLISFTTADEVERRLGELYQGDELERILDTYSHIHLSHNSWNFTPRDYNSGLQHGNDDTTGHLKGTVTAQAIHLLGILGCKEVDMIGCELGFKYDEPVHFYEKEHDTSKWTVNPHTINEHWYNSAAYIRDEMLPKMAQVGIQVNILCKSRITGDWK